MTKLLHTVYDGAEPELIQSILANSFPDAVSTLDMTFGMGRFWEGEGPTFGMDLMHARARDFVADFQQLPLVTEAVDVVLFDPPFQPQTTDGSIGKQYTKVVGGVPAVRRLVENGLAEAARVSKLGFIVKVQDYIHDHKPVWMSMWVWELLGEPYDFVMRRTDKRLKAKNWGRQLSVYRNHSTYWIYRHRSIR